MKRNILFFLSLAFVALIAISCDLNSVISPSVRTSTVLYRTSLEGVKDTITFADSLNVGDTVRMGMICEGYYDYLCKLKVSGDTSKVKTSLAWPDSLSYALASDADPEHGVLSFVPEKAYGIYTTLTYIPVASGTHEISILLTSSARESYNQYAGSFFIAVR